MSRYLGQDIEFIEYMSVLVRLSIAVQEHYYHDNSYKGNHLIVAAHIFRGLVHYWDMVACRETWW